MQFHSAGTTQKQRRAAQRNGANLIRAVVVDGTAKFAVGYASGAAEHDDVYTGALRDRQVTPAQGRDQRALAVRNVHQEPVAPHCLQVRRQVLRQLPHSLRVGRKHLLERCL